jgi:hypothetical protein
MTLTQKITYATLYDTVEEKIKLFNFRHFGFGLEFSVQIYIWRSLFEPENLWHPGESSIYTFRIYFRKKKHPLTLILILVLTFNKRRCAKTKTKNDYWYKNSVTNKPFAAGLKRLCITISGRHPSVLRFHRHSSPVTYCSQLFLAKCAKSLYSWRVAATWVKQIFWKYLSKYLFFTAAHLYACAPYLSGCDNNCAKSRILLSDFHKHIVLLNILRACTVPHLKIK